MTSNIDTSGVDNSISEPNSSDDFPLNESVADVNLDNTLLGARANKVRREISDQAVPDPKKPDRIDQETFIRRLRGLLQHQNNPHLNTGLGFLAGIVDRNPNVIREINEKDGVQILVTILIGYIEEHYEEITQELLPNNPELKTDIDNFVESYKDKGSPKELTTLYLAQLTHFAFHIIYYGYEPVENVHLKEGSPHLSCILLTRRSSIITATRIAPLCISAQYLRIAKRNDPNATSPIEIHAGDILKDIETRRSAFLDLDPYEVRSKTQRYRSFSNNRICAVKKDLISEHEAADMTEGTTSLTASCTKQ